MIEMSLEYWNKLAQQIILISSLLSGFSIAVIASLLVYESTNHIVLHILKAATIAAGCFLVTVFAMTNILMKTTPGYPFEIIESDLFVPRMIGIVTYTFGIIALSLVISLTGWAKSRSMGIFTTTVGVVTLLLIFISLVDWDFM